MTNHLVRQVQTSRSLVVLAEKGKLGSWVEMPCLFKEKKPSLSKMHSINTKGNLAQTTKLLKETWQFQEKENWKHCHSHLNMQLYQGKKVWLSFAIYILHEKLENTIGNRIAQRYIHYVGAATLLEPRSKCKSQEESICRLNHSLPLDLIWKILHSWNRLT